MRTILPENVVSGVQESDSSNQEVDFRI